MTFSDPILIKEFVTPIKNPRYALIPIEDIRTNTNTHFQVRSLEAQGVPSKQAEAITSTITEVLNDSLENVSDSFVSKSDMQKTVMLQEANLSKFKSKVQSSQEHHFSMLQRETEKLRTDIEKMRSELRYEIDKVTAGQRLDLNLERGRIRDELANQSAETANLTNKLDREIHGLKAQLEAAKYDVIKYCIGTLISISAVGLAVIRILPLPLPSSVHLATTWPSLRRTATAVAIPSVLGAPPLSEPSCSPSVLIPNPPHHAHTSPSALLFTQPPRAILSGAPPALSGDPPGISFLLNGSFLFPVTTMFSTEYRPKPNATMFTKF
ncbi:hypothetical protein E3N88_04784 [Mikania micrantha]|uniref:DUF1640 domain-containing protein n=1 Tax=Mikania micrantha TaxID=192012 RepID=A0A5N6PX90_9ASTR|nr:hypothetical protein E3N88_04784 [Mikania micrantha]